MTDSAVQDPRVGKRERLVAAACRVLHERGVERTPADVPRLLVEVAEQQFRLAAGMSVALLGCTGGPAQTATRRSGDQLGPLGPDCRCLRRP